MASLNLKKLTKENINYIVVLSLLILFLTVSFLALLLLNDIVINVRLFELQSYLNKFNKSSSKNDFLGMLSQYKLNKEYYENKINEEKFTNEELKVSYLINTREEDSFVPLSKYKGLSIPILFLINKIRGITKQELIQYGGNDLSEYLNIGYYYERNKNFLEAINLYNKALKIKFSDKENKPLLLLHLGFSNSIVGNYSLARDEYIKIINSYQNEEVAVIAAILLRYLDGFRNEIETIKNSSEDSVVKSEKLIKLIAYKDAIEILNTINTNDKALGERVKFYKARCFEELGQKTESTKNYQEIILKNPDSEYAKSSNRRLLVIASNDKNGENLKKLVKKNNELINDESFQDLVQISEKISFKEKEESTKAKEIIKQNNETAESASSQDSLTSFIENSFNEVSDKIETIEKTKTTQLKKIQVKKTNFIPKKVEVKKQQRNVTFKDKQGNIYKVEEYDENNNLLFYIVYEKDESGNLVINKYDKTGNKIN